MSITPLPAPPSRQDPNNFAERADELLAALVVFVTEANLLGADVSTQQTTASAAATTATMPRRLHSHRTRPLSRSRPEAGRRR